MDLDILDYALLQHPELSVFFDYSYHFVYIPLEM